MKLIYIVIFLLVIWCLIKLFLPNLFISERMTNIGHLRDQEEYEIYNDCVPKRYLYENDKNWKVNYDAGAGCNCGDLLWNIISPNRILTDNGLNCNEINNVNNNPNGISDNFILDKNTMKSDYEQINGKYENNLLQAILHK